QVLHDRVPDLRGARGVGVVPRRPQVVRDGPTLGDDRRDRRLEPVPRVGLADVPQQHRSAQHQGHRVGAVQPAVARGGPVGRLEDREPVPQVRARRNAEPADDPRAQVRDDVAVQVRQDQHVVVPEKPPPPSLSSAPGATPSPPTIPAHRSEMMSPYRFGRTSTSWSSGRCTSCIARLSMIRSSNVTSGYARATSRAASRNSPSENFMMLALCPAVTFRRPFALAYSNANRAILRLAVSLIALIDRPESSRTRLPVF